MRRFEAWAERREQGEAVEEELRRIFAAAGIPVWPNPNTAAYDFAIHAHGRWQLVEVKDESTYADSENVCVEVRQGRPPKPSGISISEATVTLHVFGHEVVAYRTQRMRLWMKGQARPVVPFGGSDNYTAGWLVPRVVLLSRGSWVDGCSLDGVPASRIWTQPP